MMRFAMLATASAIAFAFTIGSVSAADQFTTLKGVKAVSMSAAELNTVKGMDHHFFILVDADHPLAGTATINGVTGVPVLDPNNSTNASPLATAGRMGTDWKQDSLETNPTAVGKPGNFQSITFPTGARVTSPAYNGLKSACGNGTIEGPGFLC
jgi:hypothetical protein